MKITNEQVQKLINILNEILDINDAAKIVEERKYYFIPAIELYREDENNWNCEM